MEAFEKQHQLTVASVSINQAAGLHLAVFDNTVTTK